MRRSPSLFARPDRRTWLAGVGALGLTALAAGCDRKPAPVDEEGRIRLRFAVRGAAGARHGGFYQAAATGLYERRGLNVQIIQTAPDADTPQLLADGAVELGLAQDSAVLFRLVAEGAPVKAVAAFFQTAPQALIARVEPAVQSLSNLTGRTLFTASASGDIAAAWLKARHGLVDPVPAGQNAATPLQAVPLTREAATAAFLADRQAVLLGDLTLDPFVVEQATGARPRVLSLSDDGYSAYGGLLLAPNNFARDNAAALRAFIAASVEGWRDYIHGEAAPGDALIRRSNAETRSADLDRARQALRAGGLVDGGDAALYGLGAMTPERWRAFHELAVGVGAVANDLDWRQAFTTQYLPGRS